MENEWLRESEGKIIGLLLYLSMLQIGCDKSIATLALSNPKDKETIDKIVNHCKETTEKSNSAREQ